MGWEIWFLGKVKKDEYTRLLPDYYTITLEEI